MFPLSLLVPDELTWCGKVISGAPLGIAVTFGSALWLVWAAFIILFLSLLPYVVRYVKITRIRFRSNMVLVATRIEHGLYDLE